MRARQIMAVAVTMTSLMMLAGCMSRAVITSRLSAEDLKKESDNNVCNAAYAVPDTPKTVIDELVRRNLLRPEYGRAIIEEELVTGMTWCEATLVWGPPNTINNTVDAKHSETRMYWNYIQANGRYFDKVVYFQDDALTGVFSGPDDGQMAPPPPPIHDDDND